MPPRNNLNLSGLPSRQDNQPVVSTPVVSNWRQQALARDQAMAQDPRFQALSPYMQDIILKDQYGPNFIFEPGTGMVDRQGNIVWDDSLDVNGFRIFAAQNPNYEYAPKFLLNTITTPTNGVSIAEQQGDTYEDPTEGYVQRQTTPNYSLNSGVSFSDLTPIEQVRRLEQIYRLNPTPQNAYRLNEARSFLTANPYDATIALLAVNSSLAGAPFAAEYPALMSFVGDAAKAYALDRGIQAIHELNGGKNYYMTDAISPLADRIDDPFYRNLVLGASEYASPVWWYGPGLLNAAARSIGRRGITGAINNLSRQAVNQGTNLARGFRDTFNFGNITVPNAYMYATNQLNNIGNFVTNPRTLTTAAFVVGPGLADANANQDSESGIWKSINDNVPLWMIGIGAGGPALWYGGKALFGKLPRFNPRGLFYNDKYTFDGKTYYRLPRSNRGDITTARLLESPTEYFPRGEAAYEANAPMKAPTEHYFNTDWTYSQNLNRANTIANLEKDPNGTETILNKYILPQNSTLSTQRESLQTQFNALNQAQNAQRAAQRARTRANNKLNQAISERDRLYQEAGLAVDEYEPLLLSSPTSTLKESDLPFYNASVNVKKAQTALNEAEATLATTNAKVAELQPAYDLAKTNLETAENDAVSKLVEQANALKLFDTSAEQWVNNVYDHWRTGHSRAGTFFRRLPWFTSGPGAIWWAINKWGSGAGDPQQSSKEDSIRYQVDSVVGDTTDLFNNQSTNKSSVDTVPASTPMQLLNGSW